MKQFIRAIPYWAYLLVLLVISVNILYFVYKRQIPVSGSGFSYEKGRWVYAVIPPGSPAEKAGLKVGDTLVSINSMTMEEWTDIQRAKAGDTIQVRVIRADHVLTLPLIFARRNAGFAWFFIMMLIIICIFSIASLYLLYKKPHDLPVRLFFLFMLCDAVGQNALGLPFHELLSAVASVSFNFSACIMGPVLVHFHLLFPKPSKMITRFPQGPAVLYVLGLILFFTYSTSHTLGVFSGGNDYWNIYVQANTIVRWWITLTYTMALATALYQFHEIKDTLARNQLRMVIIGSFFALSAPIGLTIFPAFLDKLQENFPVLIEALSGLGALILVGFCLVAILQYRIWETEIFIRKTLLYLGATLIITLSYFLMIYLVNLMTTTETNITRFLILAVSVIVFLVLRDRMQRIIDRFFHRESYDTATVISDFEERLTGVYHVDELKSKIVQGLDDIFHFKSFVFNLKTREYCYEPVFAIGADASGLVTECKEYSEFEQRLVKSKVFAPAELNFKPAVFERISGELVVPLVARKKPAGFFICGQKKSERIYSQQDIRILSILARRVIALLHTASLYQKDIERQLMLERERARISQDMHDDVGASLTRISILSELAKNHVETAPGTKLMLGQISDTSRDVMEEMNQIIWALNPKNDTLEGLVSYLRRFAFEYLEPSSITCTFSLPETLPILALSVEVRRNIYLSVREALHNVVKHSGATSVIISLTPQPPHPGERGRREESSLTADQIIITIRDDGKGFDPGNLEFQGNGLLNMKKRMKDVGGEFLIKAGMGEGTVITLVVPV